MSLERTAKSRMRSHGAQWRWQTVPNDNTCCINSVFYKKKLRSGILWPISQAFPNVHVWTNAKLQVLENIMKISKNHLSTVLSNSKWWVNPWSISFHDRTYVTLLKVGVTKMPIATCKHVRWLWFVGERGIKNVDDVSEVREQFFFTNFFTLGFMHQILQPREQTAYM